MKASNGKDFERNYALHLQHRKLKGLQPKTVEAYSRAIRRIGARFDGWIEHLTEQQLTDYSTDLVVSHSWSTVKLDLYGLKFYYAHLLRRPWVAPGLIKPPKSQRLSDIVTVAEARRLFAATRLLADLGWQVNLERQQERRVANGTWRHRADGNAWETGREV